MRKTSSMMAWDEQTPVSMVPGSPEWVGCRHRQISLATRSPHMASVTASRSVAWKTWGTWMTMLPIILSRARGYSITFSYQALAKPIPQTRWTWSCSINSQGKKTLQGKAMLEEIGRVEFLYYYSFVLGMKVKNANHNCQESIVTRHGWRRGVIRF